MSKSFTITRNVVVNSDPAELMDELVRGTGSGVEAASVMRSLERLGSDPSIEYYEISQVAGRRVNGSPATNAWRVRADRGIQEIAEEQ